MPKYRVTIEQVWSEEVEIFAKNSKEAKKKAWEKYKPKKRNWRFWTYKYENN